MGYRYRSCWQGQAGVYGMLGTPIHHLTTEYNAVRKKKMALSEAMHGCYKPANANN